MYIYLFVVKVFDAFIDQVFSLYEFNVKMVELLSELLESMNLLTAMLPFSKLVQELG